MKELVEGEEWLENLKEMRMINQMADVPVDEDSGHLLNQIKHMEPLKIRLAEEEIAQRFEEEERKRLEQEEQERIEEMKERQQRILLASAKKSEALSDDFVSQSNVEADFKREMERMYMEREDKLSLQFNNALHRARFN